MSKKTRLWMKESYNNRKDDKKKRMDFIMIQDIAPHQYDNSFQTKEPAQGDYACLIDNNRMLLIKKEEGGPLSIPTIEEAGTLVPDLAAKARYLFAIDGESYFLIEEAEDGFEQHLAGREAAGIEWKGTQYFREMEPMYQAFAAITAIQVWRWRESRRYCGHCGVRMEDSKVERALICPECNQVEYPKISPAVIVAITNGDKLLMSRYRDRPYRGYALIAGFVEIGESFEETIHREVMEEVGLKVKNIRYFGSQPWAFTDTEMIGFFAELDGDDTICLQEDELSEAGWYKKEEIPDDDLLISVGSEMKMAFKYGSLEAYRERLKTAEKG